MSRILAVLGLLGVVLTASIDEDGLSRVRRQVSSNLTVMEQFIIGHSYVVERHNVTTPDGYILGVFRIPFAQYETSAPEDRPVVFLMHGLYGQSINLVSAGPQYAIGFNLADAGFDVWFGNARGNINSRAHVSLDPDADKAEFFDFSWEEIGMIDVPAMIDYVLAYTGKDQLHYIGHSQGGTVFLVMASMVPEYNAKLASVHLLAGVGYMNFFPNEQLKLLAAMTEEIHYLLQEQDLYEVTPQLLTDLGMLPEHVSRADLCFGDLRYKRYCDLIGAKYFLRQSKDTEEDRLENFGGGSTKQVAHYGQNIRDLVFRRFSYEPDVNQQLYNSSTPPAYNLGLITSNVVMHYSLNDTLLDERDVLAMASDMPNTRVRKVARDSFAHEDFSVAHDAKELVTDWIIQQINNVHNGVEGDGEEESEGGDSPNAPNATTTLAPDTTTTAAPDAAHHLTLTTACKVYLVFCAAYSMLR